MVPMNSGAALGESSKGVSDLGVRVSECENSVESSGIKGILTDEARALEEPKVLDRGSNAVSVNTGIGLRRSRILDINDRSDVSLVQPMFPGGRSVMELVGRVLRGNYDDNDVDDGNIANRESGRNFFADSNTWRGVVAEPTSSNRVGGEGTVNDNDSDRVSSGCRGSGLDGSLVTYKSMPDGKSESEEADNAEADVLLPKGCGESVIVEPTSGNGIVVEGIVTDSDSDRLSSGCQGSSLDGNLVTNKCMPDEKTESENADNAEADILRPNPQSEIVEPTSGNGISGEGNITGNDSDRVSSGCRGTDFDGNLVTNRVMPNGKSEIEEANNAEADALIPKGCGEKYRAEKEGEYYVSDLVWGKVRSHPWWPGQIFAPTAASDEALRYIKGENHLIAYFGDQSFAWIEESKIKPFRMFFPEMEKQSNAEGFSHAVSCAIDEVARRVEVGLACPCVSKDVRSKINTQVVINSGIRKESSRREGRDNLYSAASFLPGELMQFIESLAGAPHSSSDRLQFAIMKARLVGFNRWKGHNQLPVFKEHGGLLEEGEANDSLELMSGGLPGANDVQSRKRKLTAKGGSSRKQNQLSGDERPPQRKERCMSVLMSSSFSSLQNEDEGALKRSGRKNILSGGKRKAMSSALNNVKVKRQKNLSSLGATGDMASQAKTSPRVGEHIFIECSSDAASTGYCAGKSQTSEMIPNEILSPDETLSRLSLAARSPIQGHDILMPVVGSLREFRNSICQESASATTDTGKEKGKHPTNLESTDTFGSEGVEDSYWTDRIIQGYSRDQVLFEPETHNERTAKLEPDIGGNVNLGSNKESLTVNPSETYCPTAMILEFTDVESIPSVSNLNEIFRRYGPLDESETKILKKSKSARVMFKNRADAEAAYSSPGKYSIFGPSLKRYHLNFAPTPRKARASSKQNKKDQP